VLDGVGAQGITGQGRDLGSFHALAAHVADHGGPPRPPDMEQIVEVTDHGGSACRWLIRRRHIQAGDRPQERGQQAVLEAAGQRLGDKQ
jgi:hypothetical protein